MRPRHDLHRPQISLQRAQGHNSRKAFVFVVQMPCLVLTVGFFNYQHEFGTEHSLCLHPARSADFRFQFQPFNRLLCTRLPSCRCRSFVNCVAHRLYLFECPHSLGGELFPSHSEDRVDDGKPGTLKPDHLGLKKGGPEERVHVRSCWPVGPHVRVVVDQSGSRVSAISSFTKHLLLQVLHVVSRHRIPNHHKSIFLQGLCGFRSFLE
mmetsp:Transcript_3678/g.7588  ORF Transcript_3678/g.7588 Transcript_3678/m.7588 type:complete len:208 (-) Transcript_3678:699-1322(-)